MKYLMVCSSRVSVLMPQKRFVSLLYFDSHPKLYDQTPIMTTQHVYWLVSVSQKELRTVNDLALFQEP
jgi:hypothetical protein